MKKCTTTFLSHRHLGHYKSFVVSNGNGNTPQYVTFDLDILKIISTILNTTINTGVPLTQWLSSIVVMIEKIPATPRINKLIVINIYEANYSLLLKFF